MYIINHHRHNNIMSTTKEEYLNILLGKEKVDTTLSTVKCERQGCDSTDIKTWEFQTRASDEGITLFFKCRKCNYVWIEN